MNWTSEYPTKPGFYWVRRYDVASYHDAAESLEPTIVEVEEDLKFWFIGCDSIYRQEHVRSAEWQGPIEPQRENQNIYKVKFRPFPDSTCRDCGDPSERFISWPVSQVEGRLLFGIICRECWIKRLTPEQRKVYMVSE